MNKKTIATLITLGAIVLLIAIGTGYYIYWNKSKKIETGKDALKKAGETAGMITENATKGVLPSLSADPLANNPDINPADKANPFKNVKTNPFE